MTIPLLTPVQSNIPYMMNNFALNFYWKSRELILDMFAPKDEYDRLVYRLNHISSGFLRNILSQNMYTARVRSLKENSRKLDSYLKWVINRELEEDINAVVLNKVEEQLIRLPDFFSYKGVLQDAVKEFENLKPSMVRFIRLYQNYAMSSSSSYEKDYFLRVMAKHMNSIRNLVEDLHELAKRNSGVRPGDK